MSQCVLVVDRGSTNVKAVLFDTLGQEIRLASRPSQKPFSPHANWCEQDMAQMWADTVVAIREVLSDDSTPREILGVFVTGQGNGLMPLGKDLRPIRAGILSLDSRAAEIFTAWQTDGRYLQASQTVGMPFAVGSPLPLLAWFKANAPVEFSAMHKVVFSKDWIRQQLCGVLCTDPSDASGAGLMNLAENRYAEEIFDLLGLGDVRCKLPDIRPSNEVVGHVTLAASQATSLPEGTPVFCGAHDIGAFPFGVGSLDPRQLVSVVGTWGLNLLPVKNPTGAVAAFYHTVPGYFLAVFGDGNSGGCLDAMIGLLCAHECNAASNEGISVYQYIDRMISGHEPSSVLFQPYMFGSPLNPGASAGFVGLRSWHERADLLLAIYEGIAFGHLANIQFIPGQDTLEAIWLIGGGSNSPVLGQLFADVTGLPVKIPRHKEITARGGALLALVGLGVYTSYADACREPELDAIYVPNEAQRSYYQEKIRMFSELFAVHADVWTALNSLECRAAAIGRQ
jgi:L-xylulokinase